MSRCHPACQPGQPCFAAQCPHGTGVGSEPLIGVGNVSRDGEDIQIHDDSIRRIPGARIGNFNYSGGGQTRVVIGSGGGGGGSGSGGGGSGGGGGGGSNPESGSNPTRPVGSGPNSPPNSRGGVRIGVGMRSDQDINVGVYHKLPAGANNGNVEIGNDNFTRGDHNVRVHNNDFRDGFERVSVGNGNYAAGSNRIVVDSSPAPPRPWMWAPPPPPRPPPPPSPPPPPQQWWWPPMAQGPWWQHGRPMPDQSTEHRRSWFWW